MTILRNEGSITYTLRHDDRDWYSNPDRYSFPPISQGGINVTTTKQPSGELELIIRGIFGTEFTFRESIPASAIDGLSVAITWNRPLVSLYLNGEPVRTLTAEGT